LLLAICTVLFTTLESILTRAEEDGDVPGFLGGVTANTAEQIVFVFAVASSLVTSMHGFMNPAARWRQLRTAACQLVSLIWQYRARVGAFTESTSNPLAAQVAFSQALQEWEGTVTNGTDLIYTSLEKRFDESIFKHCQRQGELPKQSYFDNAVDDFHTPVSPVAYLETRLFPARDFYKSRIPVCVRKRWIWQHVIFCCSAASAVLAFWKASVYVALVTAVATSALSWMEFSQLDSKIQRYTSAIQAIKNLHRWWVTLSEVEQKNRDNVTSLVMSGEAIINSEFSAWSSALSASKKSDEGSEGNEKNDKTSKRN
jgi:hypothetical protein